MHHATMTLQSLERLTGKVVKSGVYHGVHTTGTWEVQLQLSGVPGLFYLETSEDRATADAVNERLQGAVATVYVDPPETPRRATDATVMYQVANETVTLWSISNTRHEARVYAFIYLVFISASITLLWYVWPWRNTANDSRPVPSTRHRRNRPR